MRKVLLTGVLILIIYGVSYGLDAPHNESNDVTCFDCHLGGQSTVDPNTVCTTCHTNTQGGGYSKNSAPWVQTHSGTKYGNFTKQCTDCHYFHFFAQHYVWGPATYLVRGTITSITDNGDGTSTFTYSGLQVLDSNWSDPATWGQKTGNERGLILLPNLRDVSFGFEVISANTSSITVKGSIVPYARKISVGNSFALIYGQGINAYFENWTKTVKFYSNRGVYGFAHNDALGGDKDSDGNPDDSTPTGVCQVCHTQTAHWRADGTKAAIGIHSSQNGTDCTSCHPHEEGFLAAACDSCHGYPPTTSNLGGPDGLANSPDVTGSTTPGAHQKHATSTGLNYSCETCHTGYTMPEDPLQIIDIGFNIFTYGGTNTKYDGQTTVDGYRGNNGTTVSQTGTLTCSNIYCHSIVQSAGGGALTPDTADYASPVWNDPASVQCGSCHKADGVQGNATLMDSGSHTKHLNAGKGCSDCHSGAGSGTTKHVDNNIDVVISTTYGGSYSQSPNPPANGYGSCSNVYCHSDVQADGGNAGPTVYTTPTWGTTVTCDSCHGTAGGGNGQPATGSHDKHVAQSGLSCNQCHNSAGSGTTLHANKIIDISLLQGGTYSQGSHAPGSGGYGTCSSTYCHGVGTPTWGAAGSVQCGDCHAVNNTLAGSHPTHWSVATNATTADRTTAANNSTTTNYIFTCAVCHNGATHAGGPVGGGQTAEVAFDATVAGGGAYTAGATTNTDPNGFSYTNGSCSGTYCHSLGTSFSAPYGAPKTMPTWGATLTCGDCHGGTTTGPDYPNGSPKANSHNAHVVESGFSCSECHSATVDNTNTIIDKTKHVNKAYDVAGTYIGSYTYDVNGGTCSNITCHGGQNAQWGTTLTCADCHTNDMGMTATVRRGIYKAGNDFTKTSHHIAAASPADASCTVCHNRSNHTREGDPNVRLYNEDSGAAVVYDGTGASLEGFCVSCHDTDGASRLGANAAKPFTDSGDNTAPPDIGWKSSASAHTALTDKCFGCHGNSGAAGTTLDPVINAHGSDSAKLLRYTGWLSTDESGFCYNCHGNPTANGAQDDIQSVFGLTYAHGDQNCAACHNKHQAEPGLHTPQSGGIAPVNYGATVLDAAAVTWPAAWTATDFSTTATKAATSADDEWQLCLKCHNGGGPATTDIALEFNPNNASYHSVVQLNPNRNTKPAGNQSGQGGPAFVPPWSANSRMTCSDCHTNSNSTQAQGPHGSAVPFILVAPYNSNTGMAGTQDHLCFRCHDWEGYVNNNQDCKNDPCQYHTGFSNDTQTNQGRKDFNLHAYHNRKGYSCRNCHLARPHGAQGGPNNITRALLLWDGSNTPAPYRQAGATPNEWLYIITWQSSPGNWNQNNCAINTANGGH